MVSYVYLPAANVRSVGLVHDRALLSLPDPAPRVGDGCAEAAVLNDTTLAEGWTNRVSMPSAAPTSTVEDLVSCACSLLGTVTDRRTAMRLGLSWSGVCVVGADMAEEC